MAYGRSRIAGAPDKPSQASAIRYRPSALSYNPSMSELHFYEDPDDALPRAKEDMRFTAVAVQPYADGRRGKLNFKLTPFTERPSVDISVTNAAGHEVASLSLIEAMDAESHFTTRGRRPTPEREHTVPLPMFYPMGDD